MTPHNRAKKGEIAKTVLMAGDPLRAKKVADTFLKDAKLVNDVRGMLTYTGTYKGKTLTVMGHGMGMPSIGIYSYELFKFYNVENIIRFGSCGSYNKDIKVSDLILVDESYSHSIYAKHMKLNVGNSIPSNPELVKLAEEAAKENNLKIKKVKCYCEDNFYNAFSLDELVNEVSNHSDVVEMESFALYANAMKLNKNALTLLTVSDSLVTHESMDAKDREQSFKDMMLWALELAIKMDDKYAK